MVTNRKDTMTDNRNFSRMAADSRTAALALDRANRPADAQKARADSIRYDRLAKLAKLGAIRVG